MKNIPINLFRAIEKGAFEEGEEALFVNYLKKIQTPCFYLSDIGISAKLLNDWIKAGILDEVEDKSKWRLYTFIEAIWLKFVEELRFFGVPLAKISELKKDLFEIDIERFKMLITNLQQEESKLSKNLLSVLELVFKDGDEQAKIKLKELGFSFFSSIILTSMMQRLNLAFVYGRDIHFELIDLNNYLGGLFSEKIIDNSIQNLNTRSFVLINIKSLFTRFFGNEKLDANMDFYMGIMNTNEKKLIEQIRSGDYSKITVSLEEDRIVLTRATKKDGEELMKKVARLLKKGDFKEIEIIARDGKIVKYNETDIIK